ncbi:MAG TPA: ligand-binding protein SH3 [Saprospiraceae bacterium]|nr:ligand-binding protein SH3 [Saprospiraceae bacterium]
MNNLIYSILLSMIPIAELRGGIPYALANGISPVTAYFACTLANLMAFPIVYIFFGFFHDIFSKMDWYKRLFDKLVLRTRGKVEDKIEKWGFWGLMIFVMIPLPVTGAYTGSFAAWLFGIPKRKAFLAVSLGVFIAGLIVTAVFLSGSHALDFLLKKM